MDSKIKWLVIFQRVNDDWSVETGDVWCCAPDVEAVKAKFQNMQDATIVRIEEYQRPYADRALTYFEEQVAQFDSVSEDNELAEMIADVAYSLQVIARNARNKAKDL